MPHQNSQTLSALMPREGHVLRADHRRNEIVRGEAGQPWDEEAQDHRRSVEVERGVIGIRRSSCACRYRRRSTA